MSALGKGVGIGIGIPLGCLIFCGFLIMTPVVCVSNAITKSVTTEPSVASAPKPAARQQPVFHEDYIPYVDPATIIATPKRKQAPALDSLFLTRDAGGGPVVGRAPKGRMVGILEATAGHTKIESDEGARGWVESSKLGPAQ